MLNDDEIAKQCFAFDMFEHAVFHISDIYSVA